MTERRLNPRSLTILKSLIERYIEDGQPVGSKSLARESQLELSSASIRHIMADLERRGYLSSPHTSAGRVPTTAGYRLFIDHWVTVQQPAGEQVAQIKQELSCDHDAKALVAKASNLLSGITHLTGVVTLPLCNQWVLRQVEFLALSDNRVLVIVVYNDYQVENRVLRLQSQMSKATLERAGNLITALCAGKDFSALRNELFEQLQQSREDLDSMLQTVMEVAENATDATQSDVVVKGQAHLLNQVDSDNVQGLKRLFESFTQKSDLLKLLDQTLHSPGIKIFVGHETGYAELDRYSIVSAPYYANDEVAGVLGVIGPRRMAYNEVVTTVDVTAKLLSHAFGVND